jgi:hypothetical protein
VRPRSLASSATRGFVYLNLNGGDSWGYYHPEDNAEYIYNFKGEPVYKTSELLPEYWASLNKVEPIHAGQVRYFVCRDFRTDRLYNGMHYVDEDRLDMARASNEGRLRSFLKQHGSQYKTLFLTSTSHTIRTINASSTLKHRFINTYVPSALKLCRAVSKKQSLPMVKRVIESAVGKGEPYEHFLNWLADIVQFKEKDRHRLGAAWK